ncbi:MAG: hypothetical protein WCE61_08730 [Candidatus Acidiferrum sp.]
MRIGVGGALLLERFEIFEEEEPGSLLDVVELGGAAGFLAEDIVDVFEDLFEHGATNIRNLNVKENSKLNLIHGTGERLRDVP